MISRRMYPSYPLQGARAEAPSPLVVEPPAHVVSQADPLGRGVPPSVHVQDELVEGALGFPPGGEAALALLAPSAGEGMAADVHDVLSRAALADVSPHDGLLTRIGLREHLTPEAIRRSGGFRIGCRLTYQARRTCCQQRANVC